MTDERDNRPKSDHPQDRKGRPPVTPPPFDADLAGFIDDKFGSTDIGLPSETAGALFDPPTIELDPEHDIMPVQLPRDEATGDADVVDLPADAMQIDMEPDSAVAPEAAIFRRKRRTGSTGDIDGASLIPELPSGSFVAAASPAPTPPPAPPTTAPIDVMEALRELPTQPPSLPVIEKEPHVDDFFASSDALDDDDYGAPVERDELTIDSDSEGVRELFEEAVNASSAPPPPPPPTTPPPPNVVPAGGWTDAFPRAEGEAETEATDAGEFVESGAFVLVGEETDDQRDADGTPSDATLGVEDDASPEASSPPGGRPHADVLDERAMTGGTSVVGHPAAFAARPHVRDDASAGDGAWAEEVSHQVDVIPPAAEIETDQDEFDEFAAGVVDVSELTDAAAEAHEAAEEVAVEVAEEAAEEVAVEVAEEAAEEAADEDADEDADELGAQEMISDVAAAATDDGADDDIISAFDGAPVAAAALRAETVDAEVASDAGADEPTEEAEAEAPPSRPARVQTSRVTHDAATVVRQPVSVVREPVNAAAVDQPDDASPQPGADQDVSPLADRPSLDALPLDGGPPTGANTWVTQEQLYRVQVQGLARTKQWPRLAAVTAYAIMHAHFAIGATRASMLLDLARVYRDRLDDAPRARQAFEALATDEPANAEALNALAELYEARGEWAQVFDLVLRAVEHTWDPNERITWTRRCADIARNRLGDVNRTIAAWEQLWHLEDGLDEAATELASLYRGAERWLELSSFLQRQLDESSDPTRQLVLLRQLVEVLLTGLGDHASAVASLHRILARRPGDALATRQLARIYVADGAWDQLGALAPSGPDLTDADVDRLHRIAGVLWDADRVDDAADLYDRIRAARPGDAVSAERRRAWLARTGRYEELLESWEARIDEASDGDRPVLLTEAAAIADAHLNDAARAVSLLERRLELDENEATWTELVRLYRAVEDDEGIARALEGRVRLASLPSVRRDALRQLAQHYALRLADTDGAERCWRGVLSIDATDQDARDALVEIHRNRGDFEALASSLVRQLRLTAEPARAESLARRIADTVDAHFDDHAASISAWSRVLDYAPDDADALAALRRHVAATGDWRHEIDVIERQMRHLEGEARVDLAIEAAAICESNGATSQALTAYERVLRWNPSHPDAVTSAVRLHTDAGDLATAVDVLEDAAIGATTRPGRAGQLRAQLAVLPPDAWADRAALIRRCLLLGDDQERCVEELAELAQVSGDWASLADVYVMLALSGEDAESTRAWMTRYADLLERHLELPERAYAALQALLLTSAREETLLTELARLADAAGRWEDIVAIARQMAGATDSPETRAAHLRQAAEVCERRLDDPTRAFRELRRLLTFDPDDESTLRELLRLAEEHGLWRQFDAVLAEVGDRTRDDARRVRLLTDRQKLARGPVADADLAARLGLRRLRHAPGDVEEQGHLVAGALAPADWKRLLPALEAGALAADAPDADELVRLAALHLEHLDDASRAFDLCRLALASSPTHAAATEEMVRCGERTGRLAELVEALRGAAARCQDSDVSVALLRRAVAMAASNESVGGEEIELHRRLVELRPDELPSLKALIGLHRDAEQWWDLRDRLGRLVDQVEDDAARIEPLLEIAALSDDRLGDAAAAISACRRVLAIDPDHAGARARLEQLVDRAGDPALRLSTLRLDLDRATPTSRAAILLEIAEVESALGETDASLATLRGLVAEAGIDSGGFDPLVDLLRVHGPVDELVELLMQRADAASAPAVRAELLRDALDQVRFDSTTIAPERYEEILRALLALDASDADVRARLLRLLRASGRANDWLEIAEAAIERESDGDRRRTLAIERARILANQLDRPDDAAEAWRALGEAPDMFDVARQALASLALRRGDVETYATLRRDAVPTLSPEHGALVLCHLAEVADEYPAWGADVAELYREARRLDANCAPAQDALKAIGRRLPNLRAAAALLPDDDERSLDHSTRAARLTARAADESDPRAAIEWLLRAVAVDPDHVEAWQALATARSRAGRDDDAWGARQQAWWATVRRDPVDPSRLANEADTLYQLALGARATGDEETWARLVRDVHDRVPHHVAAGRVAAQVLVDAGRFDEASRQLDTLVRLADASARPVDRAALLQLRGVARHARGDVDGALADLREATTHAPLGADVLRAASGLEAAVGDLDAAREYSIRALVSEPSAAARAELLLRVGQLWERGGDALDEAGACYEMALSEGLESRELLDRVFRHYQRTGAVGEGLSIVDDLIASTADDNTDELARLWTARGELLAARDDAGDDAVEAFDMALSYDPGRGEAREGLATMLERRGDWEGLVQILEAIAEGADELRGAAALRRVGAVCAQKLGDSARAERYLRASIDMAPDREAIAQLAALLSSQPARAGERLALLGRLAALGPPWMEPAAAVGQAMLDTAPRRAWCVLAPMLMIRTIDDDLKAQLRDMRRDYEKPPVLVVPEQERAALWATSNLALVHGVMCELDDRADVGEHAAAARGADELTEVSVHSSIGRACAALAEHASIDRFVLARAGTLDEPIAVLKVDGVTNIIVRADIFQQMARAEVGFVLAYAFEMARPGARGLAAMRPSERAWLVPALWHALGFAESADPSVAGLAEALVEQVPDETWAGWRERLAPLASFDAAELGAAYLDEVTTTAYKLGLVAGADIYQIARLLSRMDERIERPGVYAGYEAFDDYVACSHSLSSLLAFAASPTFTRLHAAAIEVGG